MWRSRICTEKRECSLDGASAGLVTLPLGGAPGSTNSLLKCDKMKAIRCVLMYPWLPNSNPVSLANLVGCHT